MENDRPHRLHPIGAYMSESERARSAMKTYPVDKKAGIVSDIVIGIMVFLCVVLATTASYSGGKNERVQHESKTVEQLPTVRE